MPTTYDFHPEALLEYSDATSYYLSAISVQVAEAFTASVESAIAALVAAPTRWRVVQEPEIRRHVLSRFPFVIYYRWDAQHERVAIYAIMHCSREPGYWHHRTEANQ